MLKRLMILSSPFASHSIQRSVFVLTTSISFFPMLWNESLLLWQLQRRRFLRAWCKTQGIIYLVPGYRTDTKAALMADPHSISWSSHLSLTCKRFFAFRFLYIASVLFDLLDCTVDTDVFLSCTMAFFFECVLSFLPLGIFMCIYSMLIFTLTLAMHCWRR